MPELPEVETIMNGLRPVLEGRAVVRIYVNRPDLRRPFPPKMKETLEGRHIIRLRRRAKYILCDIADLVIPQKPEWTLLLHLGMSGRLIIDLPETPIPVRKHDHLVLVTDQGSRVSLIDPRRFGIVDLFKSQKEACHPSLASLGIEPLDPDQFTQSALTKTLSTCFSSIKNALLDQKRIAGLGNIYVCEALFHAKIHPGRMASELTQEEISRLWYVIPEILNKALSAGGSTLRDYVQADGSKGSFQELHQVYGREGQPCPACPKDKCPGIQRIIQSGRSTFFCPQRQKDMRKIS